MNEWVLHFSFQFWVPCAFFKTKVLKLIENIPIQIIIYKNM